MVSLSLPWAAVPGLDNPFGEAVIPNIQSKSSLEQLEATSLPSVTGDTDPHLAGSFPVAGENFQVFSKEDS